METVFFNFFSDTDSNGNSLLVHLNRTFQLILHSGQWKRFLVNYKPFAFTQSFFLQVDTIYEIKCASQFLQTNIIPARRNHFLGFLQIFPRVEAAFSG